MSYRGGVGSKQRESRKQRHARLALWSQQNRQLQSSDPPRLDNGRRLIRVFPEWGTELPLWESFSEHYPVQRGDVVISDALLSALTAWSAEWQNRSELDYFPDEERWVAEGHSLVSQLRAEMHGVADIRAEFGY